MTKRPVTDADVKRLMDQLTPDQRGVARTLATYKVENTLLTAQNKALAKEHADLYKIMILLLHYYKERGQEDIRVHKSQFLRFADEYRIDRSYDQEREEVVLKLVHIRDPIPEKVVRVDSTPIGN